MVEDEFSKKKNKTENPFSHQDDEKTDITDNSKKGSLSNSIDNSLSDPLASKSPKKT